MDPVATEAANGQVRLAPASRSYVQIAKAAAGSEPALVRAPARVTFRDGAVAEVGTPMSGRVTAVKVQVGARVHAGDLLLTLASPDAAAARSSLETAAAAEQAAQADTGRQRKMQESGVGIESERTAAEAHLRQAEAELARAKNAVAYLGPGAGPVVTIGSPIDGTVISRRATAGMVAEPGGEPLVEIGDPEALWVVADVFERDLPLVTDGAPVDIEIGSLDAAVHGKVKAVGSVLASGLRRAPVYVAIDDASVKLKPGMYARVAIQSRASEGITVPATAILLKDGRRYVVYVKQGEDRFAIRDVTIGPSVDGRVQVLTGLRRGEEYVAKGALLLDGVADQLL